MGIKAQSRDALADLAGWIRQSPDHWQFFSQSVIGGHWNSPGHRDDDFAFGKTFCAELFHHLAHNVRQHVDEYKISFDDGFQVVLRC